MLDRCWLVALGLPLGHQTLDVLGLDLMQKQGCWKPVARIFFFRFRIAFAAEHLARDRFHAAIVRILLAWLQVLAHGIAQRDFFSFTKVGFAMYLVAHFTLDLQGFGFICRTCAAYVFLILCLKCVIPITAVISFVQSQNILR